MEWNSIFSCLCIFYVMHKQRISLFQSTTKLTGMQTLPHVKKSLKTKAGKSKAEREKDDYASQLFGTGTIAFSERNES